MQYVWQTCRALQKRFGEHYRRTKKPKPIDTFLYRHFKLAGHSPNDVLVQPVEKLTYDKNLTVGFLLLQCSSGVVRHPRGLRVSLAAHFCRVLIFASSQFLSVIYLFHVMIH